MTTSQLNLEGHKSPFDLGCTKMWNHCMSSTWDLLHGGLALPDIMTLRSSGMSFDFFLDHIIDHEQRKLLGQREAHHPKTLIIAEKKND